MPLYRIADFVWDIETRFGVFERTSEDYRVDGVSADFVIRTSDEAVRKEYAALSESELSYAENICVCRALAGIVAEKGGMLLHAATVTVGGHAYAFSAPSGTGKTTHIRLWKKVYGDAVTVLNGDKPILREKDGELIAYGTPWCGKERWQTNAAAPLKALCFIERGEKNAIRALAPAEALDRVFRQLLKPENAQGVAQTLRMADLLIRKIPIYLLSCNISEEAARLSFETMTAEK